VCDYQNFLAADKNRVRPADPRGWCQSRPPGTWRRHAARRWRLRHARPGRRQHQRHGDHDRRKGRRSDPRPAPARARKRL